MQLLQATHMLLNMLQALTNDSQVAEHEKLCSHLHETAVLELWGALVGHLEHVCCTSNEDFGVLGGLLKVPVAFAPLFFQA